MSGTGSMEIRNAAPAIGTVWCRAALIAYDGIFPDDAPPPRPGTPCAIPVA